MSEADLPTSGGPEESRPSRAGGRRGRGRPRRKQPPFRPDLHLAGLERRMMPSLFTVTNTSDSGGGSLRQAITAADASSGLNTISFGISGTGAQTIGLLTALPAITKPVIIDGTTESGYSGSPLIGIDGGSSVNVGIVLGSGSAGSTVEGLAISNFTAAGVDVQSSGDSLLGNWIGLTVVGRPGTDNNGVQLESSGSGTTIGGTAAADRNIISGNVNTSGDGAGILIRGSYDNLIEGNFIGTDPTGSSAIANDTGISVALAAAGTTIGGTAAGAGNVISGNTADGVLDGGGLGTLIEGNTIGGVNAAGTAILANGNDGIQIGSASGGVVGATVGGTATGAGNVISASSNAGIEITGTTTSLSTAVDVEGNKIGTDAAGTTAYANAIGIQVATGASGVTIGGTIAAARNLISGNTTDGVQLSGSGVTGIVVEGDWIGVDSTGAAPLPNKVGGVVIDSGASANTIGGTISGAGDIISGNTGGGIAIVGSNTDRNVVAGDLIGLAVAGTAAVADGIGVSIASGASDNTIGGAAAAARNVISGNTDGGLSIAGSGTTGNLVIGNFIGTNAAGTAALANQAGGVGIGQSADGNTVGGTAAADRNIISGNANAGLVINGASSDLVLGNFIGTDQTGKVALPNQEGILINSSSSSNPASGNTIGGAVAGSLNLISGNTSDGVQIIGTEATGNLVEGDWIGVDITGAAALPNQGNGVAISLGAVGNTVGGAAAADRNVISGNAGDGVYLNGSTLTGNLVQGDDIGTDATGTTAVPNAVGVLIAGGVTNETIGGTTATPGSAPGNVISGNTGAGVEVGAGAAGTATGQVLILGNLIGVDSTGAKALGNGIGVEVYGGTTTIGGANAGDGNVISANSGGGVVLNGTGATNDVVQGNFFGTNATGSATLGATTGAVDLLVFSGSNTIGGGSPGTGNVLDGGSYGIELSGSAAQHDIVLGNLLGTNPTGEVSLTGAAQAGIGVLNGATNDTIGGLGPIGGGGANGNVVSSSAIFGIEVAPGSNDIVIQGNLVGTDLAGKKAFGNSIGISIESSGNLIGGANTGQGNLVSGNTENGIRVYGTQATGNTIEGNRIGTDLAGTAALDNGVTGIAVIGGASGTTIGGLTPTLGTGAGNLISGNGQAGILFTDLGTSGNLVEGNLIGTDLAGTAALANIQAGIRIYAGSSNNTIGGTSVEARNVIAASKNRGINLSNVGTTGNLVIGDYIGTDITGTVALANGYGVGIGVGASRNTIGGATTSPGTGAGNLISGNTISGVLLSDTVTLDNVVAGNLIGTNAGGTAALPNTGPGVLVMDGPANNTIGGSVAGMANIISGNTSSGVSLIGATGAATTGNWIVSDRIGLAADGKTPLPNQGDGVDTVHLADSNVIALDAISGNNGNGITLDSVKNTLIESSFIGTDATGALGAGNQGDGIGLYSAPGATIVGNVISANQGNGLTLNFSSTYSIDAAGSDLIEGNDIGTNATGTSGLGNGNQGIDLIGGGGVTIGGTASGAGNIISGNSNIGLFISNASASVASNDVVEGNFIGLDTTGTHRIGNGGTSVDLAFVSGVSIGGTIGGARNVIAGGTYGLYITGSSAILVAGDDIGTDANGGTAIGSSIGVDVTGSSGVTIGGTTPLARDLISGNSGPGIALSSSVSSTLIEGDSIGTDATGTLPLGNSGPGILDAGATGITIGGTAAGAGNVLSDNGADGISINGAASAGILVLGNLIGTNATGELAMGNTGYGIEVDASTGLTIGGTARGAGNLIASNTGAGIGVLSNTGQVLIAGNTIGTDLAGSTAMGNAAGVLISGGSSGITIGGTAAGAGNVIADSSGDGVEVNTSGGAGDPIRYNAIFGNLGAAIGFGTSTPPVAPPTLAGENSTGGTTTVVGSITGNPNTTYTVDFYIPSPLNPSHQGGGHYLLGTATITTNATDSGVINVSFPTPSMGVPFVSATSTDPSGNTSAFSTDVGSASAPKAVITTSGSVFDVGASIQFSGAGTIDPTSFPLAYSWNFGDGTTATGETLDHTFRSPGTFTVTLTVADGFGNKSTATAQVKAIDVPPAFVPRALGTPEVLAPPVAPGSGFGTSLASVDGQAIVGAPSADGSAGVVDLFDAIPTDTPSATSPGYGGLLRTIHDPNLQAGASDHFGASVAALGNDLLVGAPGYASGQGAAYLFDANPLSPTYGQLLATFTDASANGASAAPGDAFGSAVASNGSEIAIGAPGFGGSGEILVYSVPSSSSGTSQLLHTLTDPGPTSGDGFGSALAFGISPNSTDGQLIVGAPHKTLGSPVGAVYVYDVVSPSTSSVIFNPATGTGFGTSVAADGSNIVVGSPDANNGAGAAYLYSSSGTPLLTYAQPDGAGGQFGGSVASDGSAVLIGAPGASLGASDSGAAYLFDGSAPSASNPVAGTPIDAVQESTPITGDGFGGVVGFLDVNGAILVGGPGASGAGITDVFQPGASLAVSAATTYPVASGLASVMLTGDFTTLDQGATLTGTINWGDGTTTLLTLGPGSYAFSIPHAYAAASPTPYTIVASLADPAGETATTQTTVLVESSTPAFAPGGLSLSSPSVAEGQPVSVNGSIVNGGAGANAITITWGDSSPPTFLDLAPGQTQFSTQHTYSAGVPGAITSEHTITATLAAVPGARIQQTSTSVAVTDPTPTIDPSVQLSPNPVAVGSPFTISGTIHDPGSLDPQTLTINWGDGTPATVLTLGTGLLVPVASTPGDDTFTATHAYAAVSTGPGEAITLTDANTSSTSAPVVVHEQVIPVPVTVRIQSIAPKTPGDLAYKSIATPAGASVTWTVELVDATTGALIQTIATYSQPSIEFIPPTIPTGQELLITASAAQGSATASTSIAVQTYSASGQGTPQAPVVLSINSPTPTTVLVIGSQDVISAGTSTNIALQSVGGGETLIGGTGNDTLTSAGLNDSLVGGSGNTVFQIDPGPDPSIVAGSGTNTLDFSGSGVPIALNLTQNNGTSQTIFSNTTVSYSLSLSGNFGTVVGSPLGNVITGGSNELIYGGIAPSTLTTGSGDTIIGGTGNDIIYGGTGQNTLAGGGGSSTIYGGTGNDVIYGGTLPPTLSGTIGDSITGGTGNDVIYGGTINDTIYSGVNDTIIGGTGNDIIYGGTLPPTLSGTVGGDSITGGTGNDVIYGGTVPSTITAGSGSDTIIGGTGNDIIYGGTVNETITGTSGTDTVIGGTGNDVIYGGTANTTITAGSGSDTIIGGTGNDVIYGGTTNTTLNGTSGGDTIIGGTGNDVIYGGIGNDTINAGSGSETIVGGTGNDIIYGGTVNETVTGTSGTDTVVGGTGNDVIYGGTANTTITGGSGSDTIIGGTGNDVIYGGTTNTTLSGTSGTDTVIGGTGNDLIYGGTTNDTITAGSGSDTIIGGTGNDIIYGGTVNETITGTSGTDTVIGGTGNDVIYGGTANTTITAGSGSDTIIGGTGNDVIYGGTTDTTLNGTSGSDTIIGGTGNDIIYGGTANDTINAGSGSETIIGGTGNDVIYGGTTNTTLNGTGGTDTIVGGTGNDVIYGGTGNDTITAGSGSETIIGGTGNDIIYGGTTNTTLNGTSGSDTIIGGTGNDIIYGGTGNDTINAGNGTESIVGGSGNDLIVGTTVVGATGTETIVGGTGNDIIYGGITTSSITGGTGNDVIVGTTVAGAPGTDTIVGGTGNDIIYGGTVPSSITGGTGNDVIYGGSGLSTLSAGTGDSSIVGGTANDLLIGGGPNSWVMLFGSESMTLTDTSLSTSNGTVDTISGFRHALLSAGSGDFTLDASAFTGSSLLLGGTGNDTLIGSQGGDTLVGGAGNDSLVGARGNDTFAFGAGSSGHQTVVEPVGSNVATLDFSAAPQGISINLGQSGPQTVIPGQLTLTLSDPMGISNVLGSPFNDTILGNARDNTLIGAGGQDLIAGMGGNDYLQGDVTRVVYLDFTTMTTPVDHQYTTAERNAIQAILEADYSAFSYTFTQVQPTSGSDTTLDFNDPSLTGLEGGISSSIDWRDQHIAATATLGPNGLLVEPADVGSVNVAGLLGHPGEPAATSADYIALSATIAAHELGHLSGLTHADAFGPIGSGIYSLVSPDQFLPAYAGPTAASTTPNHVMASGASVGQTLFQAIAGPYFGAREAVHLAFGADGTPVYEPSPPPESIATAQPVTLQPLVVPDTSRSGPMADRTFNVTAADVIGQMTVNAAGTGLNTDYYMFNAQAGTLLNIEVLSQLLGSPQGFFDTTVTLYGPDGKGGLQQIAYNDDSFQTTDSAIIDQTLSYTGTYYIEVSASTKYLKPYHLPLSADTGPYELFFYTFSATPDPTAGDTMYGGQGLDTIVGGPADDIASAPNPKDLIVRGSGQLSVSPFAPYLDVSAGQAQTVNEGTPVTLVGSFIDPNGDTTHAYDWKVVASNGQAIADGTGPTFTFTPGNAGTYTVTFTASAADGGSGSAQVVITSKPVTPSLSAPSASQDAGVSEGPAGSVALGNLSAAGIGPWTVSVNWGDGSTPSTFPVTNTGAISYAHAYAEEGTYTITESVAEAYGSTSTPITFDLTVADPAVQAQAVSGLSATAGTSTGTITVATFTDPAGAEPVADYAATIAWGDGTTSAGTIAYNASTGVFSVLGAHTYLAAGPEATSVAVDHEQTPAATATGSASVAKAATSTSLTLSTSTAAYGQGVTATATVSGFATSTGTVSFVDQTTGDALGSATLSEGTATFALPTLAPGTHTILATYSGDSNFLGSSATAGPLTIVASVVVTDPTASGALRLSGGAILDVPGDVIVDSSSPSALDASGGPTLKAAAIMVHGGVNLSGGPTLSPSPSTGVSTGGDPLASLASPPTSDLSDPGAVKLGGNTQETIGPGIYTQIDVGNSASLTMEPGTYIIEGGGFHVSGNGSVTGSSVFVYNAGSAYPLAGGTFGGIAIGGGGSVNLTAPTTGLYAGILFFQSREDTRALSFNGGGSSHLSGIVYAPSALVTMSDGAHVSGAIVADQLALLGGATLTQMAAGGNTSSAGALPSNHPEDQGDHSSGGSATQEPASTQDAITPLDAVHAPQGARGSEVTRPTRANVDVPTATRRVDQGGNRNAGSSPSQFVASSHDFTTTVPHDPGQGSELAAWSIVAMTERPSAASPEAPTPAPTPTPTPTSTELAAPADWFDAIVAELAEEASPARSIRSGLLTPPIDGPTAPQSAMPSASIPSGPMASRRARRAIGFAEVLVAIGFSGFGAGLRAASPSRKTPPRG